MPVYRVQQHQARPPWHPQPLRKRFNGPLLPVNTYSTTFAATENPMFEGGVWTHGLANGLDWNNMLTESGGARGTQDGNQAAGVFNDSIAVLKGTWDADQQSQATVFNNVGVGGDYFAEVELLLRFTINTKSAQGYETLFGINPAASKHYVEIVKWLGARDSFFSLTGGSSAITALATGDVVMATIVGNTITAYVNGTQVAQVTDSVGLSGTAPYTTGNPGVGHWLNNETASGDPSQYGFSDFAAQVIQSTPELGRTAGMGGRTQIQQLLAL